MPTYVITGANRGLGFEFVRQLANDGSNTIIAGTRSLDSDLSALKSINKHNNIHVLECDTSSTSSITSFASSAGKTLGDSGVDYLLNNGAISTAPDMSSLQIEAEELDKHIHTNVLGVATVVEKFLPYLKKGSLVMNMTSGLGSMQVSTEVHKCPIYSISKAALNMLTIHQAAELKPRGVRAICMDPGWVKTRMGGEGAVLEPEESISGMLKTIHGVGDIEMAKFLTYTGKEVPW